MCTDNKVQSTQEGAADTLVLNAKLQMHVCYAFITWKLLPEQLRHRAALTSLSSNPWMLSLWSCVCLTHCL